MRALVLGIGVDRDAEAFAAEHEPDDAEFPVLETVEVWMGAIVKVQERAAGDKGFASALAGGEQEGDIGDLLGQDIDSAIYPDDLFVGAGEHRRRGGVLVAAEPGADVEGSGFGGGRRGGSSDVKA